MAKIPPDVEVLVADDDDIVRQVVARLLERIGVNKVVLAADGSQALGFIGESATAGAGPKPFDLIICDWQMPKVKGIDVLRHLREKDSQVPFVMLTAEREADAVLEAKQAGVSAYIAKPIDPAKFRKVVEALIGL